MKRLIPLLCLLCLTCLLFACTTSDQLDETTTAGLTDTAQPTEELTEVPADELTEAPTAEVTEASTSEDNEVTSAEATEAFTGEAFEEPTDEVTELVTEDATEEMTEAPTEEVTTDYFEANSVELVTPDTQKDVHMVIAGEGYDVYQLPDNGNGGYRYGCTYIYNDDGSVDAFFASMGSVPMNEWDWIAYRHSPDGGVTWGPERMVVTPTPGSHDDFSCCDPGVVYFNGYYYVGYTTTMNKKGVCNNIMVARSESPEGPYEKWNGSGWGGPCPEPIITHDGTQDHWGVGEPSFIELNGTLYIYYTHSMGGTEYCMVATADARDENWPATIQKQGVACVKTTDSLDVKYVEDWGKFIAVSTGNRMGEKSWLAVFESDDGLRFELVDATRENTFPGLHNTGISSRRNGHINLAEDGDRLCIIYSYGREWASWNTRVQPIALTLTDGNDMEAEKAKPCLDRNAERTPVVPEAERPTAFIRTTTPLFIRPLDRGAFTVGITAYDNYAGSVSVPTRSTDVIYSDYDESIVTFEQCRAIPLSVGETDVTVSYNGVSYIFRIIIVEDEEAKQPYEATTGLVPVHETVYVYTGETDRYLPQLRARLMRGDGSYTEYYVIEGDPVMTFSGYDESVIAVDAKGLVYAKGVGETTVTLTLGEYSCQIKVVVTDDRAYAYLDKEPSL